MADAVEPKIAFWLSWYQLPEMGAFTLYWPWWVSGSFSGGGTTICAAVMAKDEEEAKSVVWNAFDTPPEGLAWRFCNEREPGWSPFGDRFPKADWMEWPLLQG